MVRPPPEATSEGMGPPLSTCATFPATIVLRSVTRAASVRIPPPYGSFAHRVKLPVTVLLFSVTAPLSE
jgi:hypothetical protein